MQIETVEYITDRPFPLDGETKLENPYFQVTLKDGSSMRLPPDPLNHDYREVKEWYDAHQSPPFEFDFFQFDNEPEPQVELMGDPTPPQDVLDLLPESPQPQSVTPEVPAPAPTDITGDGFVNNQSPPPSSGLSIL